MTALTPAPSGGAFGAYVAAIRRTQHVSQAQLARTSGLTHGALSRIESGNRSASRETVTRLADALELCGPQRAQFFATAGLLEHGESVTWMLAVYIDHESEEWHARVRKEAA